MWSRAWKPIEAGAAAYRFFFGFFLSFFIDVPLDIQASLDHDSREAFNPRTFPSRPIANNYLVLPIPD